MRVGANSDVIASAPPRAAIYCRVSTNNQGTDRQVVELMQFAERAGYEVVDTFTEIVSGAKTSTKDRVERAKVIELARQRQIDVILVLRSPDSSCAPTPFGR